MANEKSDIRRKNGCHYNFSNIKNSISSSFNQNSFQAVKRLDRIQKYFLWKKSSVKTTQSIKT